MSGPLPVIEIPFEARIMATIETLQQSMNETQTRIADLAGRVEAVDLRSKEAMTKVEQERATRSSELERMRQHIEDIGTRTNNRFDELAKKLDKIGDIVSTLSGKMDGWDDLLQMREETTRANSARIEKLENGHHAQENAIALLTSNHEGVLLRLKGIDRTLFGAADQPDAPASVFGTLNTIKDTLLAMGEAQQTAQKEQSDLGRELMLRVGRLEVTQKEQAEKWAKRRAKLFSIAEKIVTHKHFWWYVAGGAGVIAATPDDMKHAIAQFFVTLFGG